MKEIPLLKAGDVIWVSNRLLPNSKRFSGFSVRVIEDAYVEENMAFLKINKLDKEKEPVSIKLSDYQVTWFTENPELWSSKNI